MDVVYIVIKKQKVTNEIYFTTNEAVFEKEKDARSYIVKRKALKDRDDKGCSFDIEPWQVLSTI